MVLDLKKKIPNYLTGLRFCLIGVFLVFFVTDSYMAALITYMVAWFTDLLDGYLARKWDAISDKGKLLDPLADKLLLMTTLICFYSNRWIDLWILIVVLVKELSLIIGGIILYKRRDVVVYADTMGKLATGIFGIGVVMTFFYDRVAPYHLYVFYIALIFAMVAFVQYAYYRIIKPYFLKK